jgi:hypothetical protein
VADRITFAIARTRKGSQLTLKVSSTIEFWGMDGGCCNTIRHPSTLKSTIFAQEGGSLEAMRTPPVPVHSKRG